MNYIVTHEEDDNVSLDLGDGTRAFDLQGALAFARHLVDQGKANVTIDDGDGNRITGDALIACCDGTKTLSADLKAV